MRLRFLGTRGEIALRSREHALHSALLVETPAGRVLLDCGRDWRGRLAALRPDAIVLTHAHPDHAGGLRDGAACPVWATRETWGLIDRYGVTERRLLPPAAAVVIAGLAFEAVPVEHSLRAPTVALLVARGAVSFAYAPDVAEIHAPADALRGVGTYVGDGASLVRPIIRRRDGRPVGHAPIRTQLDWCAQAGVPRAVFTHCGSQVVRADPAEMAARVAELGRAAGVRAQLASDGLVVELTAP